MTVDEMIRYLEDCPYSDRQEPQKIAAKLRAAEGLMTVLNVCKYQLHDRLTGNISRAIFESLEAYERAGGSGE